MKYIMEEQCLTVTHFNKPKVVI